MPESLETITLKLVGKTADQHRIDAFQLAETVEGFGQVTNHCLYLLQRLKVAGKNQRVGDLQVLAKPPEAGSVEIIFVVEALGYLSPLFLEPFISHNANLLWRTVGTAFLHNSGRKDEALEMAKITFEHLKEKDKIEAEQRSEERAKDERIIHHLIEQNNQRCRPGCVGTVSSVGKTSKLLTLPVGKKKIEINEDDASIIRQSVEEYIGPETSFRCFMDGIIEHNRTIKIKVEEVTEEGRYLNAKVKDDSFGQKDNPYITALNTKRPIVVTAKPVIKDGQIVHLIISKAEVV